MLSRTLRAPWWFDAGLGILSALIASGLTLLLQLRDRPFLLPMIAVLVTALRGGFGPGLICGITTMVLAGFTLMNPLGTLAVPSMTQIYEVTAFVLTAGLISMLAARSRGTQLTLEATLASIGEGVIVTDRDGRVTFLNPAAEELTGWTSDDARGVRVGRMVSLAREDTGEPMPDPVQRVLARGVPARLSHGTVLIARDGTPTPIDQSAAVIRDEHARMLGTVLVFRDVTPRRNAEQALRRQAGEREGLLERERSARAEAERANQLKDEFLATLSHELRTPVNAVLGWAHILTRRELPPDKQQQALAAIHRNAEAQARLVEDVLDLSRIVTGGMALASEPVDLSEIVRTTADAFGPAICGRRQHLRLDLAPVADMIGDAHRLRQITWNLLSNATKFTPEGGLIEVQVTRAPRTVELTVRDTGKGIDPAFLPFVFDRFRQGDSSTTRGHGGLGLGLSLVRQLVEMHGGTVNVSSPGSGEGTTVRITFSAREEFDSGSGIRDQG